MIVILYKSYNTIICKYKLHVIFHVSEAKTGRRGCVWGLVVCPYWGRQHSIMKRVRNASNFERLFIQCPLYRYTNYTNFRSHVKWNKIHKSLAATVTNFHSHGQEENCPKSRVVFSMMRQWTIEDYRHDLKSKRRSVIVQVMHRAPSPSLLSHSAIIAMSDAKILKDIPSCVSTCFQSPLSLPLLFRLRLSSPAFQE